MIVHLDTANGIRCVTNVVRCEPHLTGTLRVGSGRVKEMGDSCDDDA